jgi:predicted dienelactone hydrolase
MRRHFLILNLIFIVLIVSACFSQKSQSAENLSEINFALSRPTGEFGTGRQLIYLSDETREKREIAVWVYYPAELKDKTLSENVLPAEWAAGYRNVMEKRLGGSASTALLSAKTFTQNESPAAAGKETFPVLIFAPGANWLPTDYSSIIEELTSSGYVVLAFAASPLSPIIRYSNGNMVESPRVDEATYKVVTDDFRFIAGQVDKLNQDSTLKINGRLDITKIGAFGHSIGGAAAIAAAADNPKIAAAVNLDGDFAGETLNANPAQPIMYLTTEPPNLNGAPIEQWDEDRSEMRRKNVWEKIKSRSQSAIRIRAATMFHSNFQDAALLPADSMPEKLRQNRFGKIEGARGVKVSTELALVFFNAHLKAGSAKVFLKIAERYPEIRIESKDQ